MINLLFLIAMFGISNIDQGLATSGSGDSKLKGIQPYDFLSKVTLEKDLTAFCLKHQVENTFSKPLVIESTSRFSQGVHFETVRFSMSKKGASTAADCLAERSLVQTKGEAQTKFILFDSGFYPTPYCENPFQFIHPPIVYTLQSHKQSPRKLVVIEAISTNMPCPETIDAKIRRFFIYDLKEPTTPLLEVEAEFVTPESGDAPHRLHLFGVKKVFQGIDFKNNLEIPSSIELNEGKFVVVSNPNSIKTSNAIDQNVKQYSNLVKLNSIYSKDDRGVYIETPEFSGQIEGADPHSFRLLSENGDSPYSKDAKSVFFFGKKIPKADAKTFLQLNDRYGKDLHRVYFMDEAMSGVDISSFVAPYKDAWYAKDKFRVYSKKTPVKFADPETFSTGENRSCGMGCTYRSDDKNYRFDSRDQVVQKLGH